MYFKYNPLIIQNETYVTILEVILLNLDHKCRKKLKK